jgi:hypothetical protein
LERIDIALSSARGEFISSFDLEEIVLEESAPLIPRSGAAAVEEEEEKEYIKSS